MTRSFTQGGFSLCEVIMTIAVFSMLVLLTLQAPRRQQIEISARQAAKRVFHYTELLSYLAARSGTKLIVEHKLPQKRIELLKPFPPWIRANDAVLVLPKLTDITTITSGIHNHRIFFDPNGIVSPCRIIVEDQSGGRCEVIISLRGATRIVCAHS